MLRHFTKKCMESTASKLFIKRCIWLHLWAKVAQFFQCLYYATQNYRIYYLAAQQQHKLQFPVCANMVCFSAQKFCHSLARGTYKLNFLPLTISGFGVLHSQKYYVMSWCIECYLTKTELGIRFQQPALIRSLYFLILTIYLSYLDQVLLPIAVMPFIYQNKAQKTFLKRSLRIL